MEKKRYFGMDVARIAALCLLLWLHFLLRNGFYSKPVEGGFMIAAVTGRIIFMCCIPLFLMITGYLKCGKPWNRNYYHSLLPILISWVIISFICIWYKVFIAEKQLSVYEWIVEFFDFSAANYSWYIEMYIGLLLVSPFFNMAWEAAGSKKKHQAMTATFIILTFLPKTVNVLALDGEHKLNIIPNYWTSLYYFTYYMIGCYIKTYQPKVKRAFAILGALAIALIFAVINRVTGHGASFNSGYTISYNHMATAAIAVLIFLSVYQLECKNTAVCRMAATISGVTLEMYLISCVFDQKIYAYQKGFGAEQYWWRGLLATGLVFLLSFLSGGCIHWISDRISRRIRKGLSRLFHNPKNSYHVF